MLQGCAVKPKPYSPAQYAEFAALNRAQITENQRKIEGPIDLYQAMARALKYNLEYRVKAAEAGLRISELNFAHYSMLPTIVANSGYTGRNNVNASSSFNLSTNTPNFSPSTSQDKKQKSADLSVSWNILDFGLSYVRARQAGDKALISAELHRKVSQRLLEEVRNTYWRAVSYQRLSGRLARLEKRISRARANNRYIARSGVTSKTAALLDERQLVKIASAIKYLHRDIAVAKAHLAELMNVPPGTNFKLAQARQVPMPGRIGMSLDTMINRAIRDRAELHDNWDQQRINKREATAAMLELLPSIEAYAGPKWNSNSFLLNANWVSWGAKASWNLMKVFQYPAKSRMLKHQDEVLRMRALALTISVMTQVHVSRIKYYLRRQELQAAADLRSVQSRLLRQFRSEEKARLISENKLLAEEMNTLIAEAKYDIANAELQAAYANLYATIGWDPYASLDSSMSLEDLETALRDSWQNPDSIQPREITLLEEQK